MKLFLFSISTILIVFFVFFTSLNFFLGGPPLYNVFNIDLKDAVFLSKNEELKNKLKIEFNKDFYIDPCGKTENGFYNLAYKQDKFGFRNNNETLFSETDLVVLGDSFGISSCVNNPNDLTSKLKQKLNNDKILNISVGGTGPYYQKEMLKKLFELNDANFKTLIWLFYEGNDHEDLKKSYDREISFSFNKSDNNFQKIEVDYYPSQNLFLLKIKLFLANYLRGFGTLVKYLKPYPELIENKEMYIDVVNDLNDYLNQKNITKKIIFYIPKYTRLAYKHINHPNLTQLNNLRNLVQTTALKNNFKFIDGSKIYHSRKNPLDVFYYQLPTHFNIKGYDILADELQKAINDN